MSFLPLKSNDVISVVYTAHPSYTFEMENVNDASEYFRSDEVFVFNSSSVITSRTLSDLNGSPVTSSYNLSGVIGFLTSSTLTDLEKVSINQLRNIYATASFVKEENYTSSSIFDPSLTPQNQTVHLLNIPQILYSSEIEKGSFFLQTDKGYEYYDDTYGGVFSGSDHVGCIFYQHGIVQFGSKISPTVNGQMTLHFSGTHKIPMNLYLCRADRGLLNFSTNPSYTSYVSSSNSYETTTAKPKTFVTGLGLYDEDYKLVGVAKISTPILNEEDVSLLFRLKLVF